MIYIYKDSYSVYYKLHFLKKNACVLPHPKGSQRQYFKMFLISPEVAFVETTQNIFVQFVIHTLLHSR